MSEENKDLGDKAKETFDDVKKEAKETFEEVKEGAQETFEEVKEALSKDNKKVVVGLLAIFLGGFGVHKFVLGYNKEGIILLAVTLIIGGISCGLFGWVAWIIGIIEGIIYLTKTDEDFYNIYQVGKKPWF